MAVSVKLPEAFDSPPRFPFHVANLGGGGELARKILGESSYTDWVAGLGDADYWAFEFSCGLRICYEFIRPLFPSAPCYGSVFADLPEIHHATRHMTFPEEHITPSTIEHNQVEIDGRLHDPYWKDQLASLNAFQIYRTDTNGNEEPYGEPDSQRSLGCWISELGRAAPHARFLVRRL